MVYLMHILTHPLPLARLSVRLLQLFIDLEATTIGVSVYEDLIDLLTSTGEVQDRLYAHLYPRISKKTTTQHMSFRPVYSPASRITTSTPPRSPPR